MPAASMRSTMVPRHGGWTVRRLCALAKPPLRPAARATARSRKGRTGELPTARPSLYGDAAPLAAAAVPPGRTCWKGRCPRISNPWAGGCAIGIPDVLRPHPPHIHAGGIGLVPAGARAGALDGSMFVAHVVGPSMEPGIPAGAWGLFRAFPADGQLSPTSLDERRLLVRLASGATRRLGLTPSGGGR
jgi:hypothetical protein